MKLSAAALGASFVFLGAVGGAHANLVTNGSFENGSFVDNTGQDTDSLPGGSTSMTGWTVAPGHNVSWIGPSNPFGLAASAGSYFLDLTDYSYGAPYGGVDQTIATHAGATYSLTFDLGSSSTYGLQDGILATAGSTSKSFTSTNDLTMTNLWQSESLSFTATSSSTQISLVGNSGYNYIGLDNVSVVQTSGAVPEPATWAMMLLGFAGLGFAARRRARMNGGLALFAR